MRNSQHAVLVQKIDNTITEFIEEIPQKINKLLNTHMAKTMGFSVGWNGDFDHNSGKSNPVTGLLAKKVEEHLEKIVERIPIPVDEKSFITAFTKAFKDRLRYQLEHRAAKMAEIAADGIADKFCDKTIQEIEGLSFEITEEIVKDPTKFTTRISKLLLEDYAEENLITKETINE